MVHRQSAFERREPKICIDMHTALDQCSSQIMFKDVRACKRHERSSACAFFLAVLSGMQNILPSSLQVQAIFDHCIFLSTVFAVFSTPYHLFSTRGQLFSTPPPIFLYLRYYTALGARSLLLRYIHPFGLYKRSLQLAHPVRHPKRPATPPRHPHPHPAHPARHPHPAPPGLQPQPPTLPDQPPTWTHPACPN